ncbi:MAG: malate dehydrogenase [Chloroflexi bacterium]|nr:malate dehydrogenase [Chloroflexota bacterium]
MRPKVSIIGAGNVGAACAMDIARHGYADVVLMDIVEGLAQGKALDILQSGPLHGSDAYLIGTTNYEDTADSRIVVVTSGVARKPGMSRDDLVLTNRDIVREVVRQVVTLSPRCILLAVTNPLDAMAYLAFKVSGFPRERVVGMSGILDSTRFRTFIARELGVSVDDITAFILGGHGDTMVPIPRFSTVSGMPITQLLSEDTIERLVNRTIQGGGEIVELLKAGSAYQAPGAAVAQMVEAILLDRKRVLPCSVYLDGEYGLRDVFLGVPVRLGSDGMEKVFEVALSPKEKAALERSAQAVRELIKVMKL